MKLDRGVKEIFIWGTRKFAVEVAESSQLLRALAGKSPRFPLTAFRTTMSQFSWQVAAFEALRDDVDWRVDNRGKQPLIGDCLKIQDQWLSLLEATMSRIISVT